MELEVEGDFQPLSFHLHHHHHRHSRPHHSRRHNNHRHHHQTILHHLAHNLPYEPVQPSWSK